MMSSVKTHQLDRQCREHTVMNAEDEGCNVQQQTGEPVPLAIRLGQLPQTIGFRYPAGNKAADFVQRRI